MTPPKPTIRKGNAKKSRKAPYEAPTLKTYGDLKALTQGKRGSSNDGGSPRTRLGPPV
jgi:hypothetical protein